MVPLTENFPEDPMEDKRRCANCGHLKKSHKYANTTWSGETAYIYRSCRKHNCGCESYQPRQDTTIEDAVTGGA